MEEQNNNQANEEEYICSECGAEISIDDKICPKCGADVSDIVEDEPGPNEDEKSESILLTTTRFKTLLGIGKFIAGYGWLIVIGGIVALILGVAKLDEPIGIPSLIWGFSAIGLGIFSVAFGQSIECFVSIEKNTRETTELLKVKS